ncbi:3-hydroxyacyl-CoA dehydrogenase [Candidatus Rhodobacter oscarellae]|uniref:3-hydroxyacyl-CoA dehydrogenase n=1 Tax=Candidatus Rhodobacter oscarellae TaxID=1675527 RepID=A0A0J9E0L8_9RHOB|nr:3-hydroxyacyl-CoA dehydrogenase NAD-binding domain-containing protein [Candidatus Rhodobacter lobularis]KMW56192.1 3-hydroxyacyl-CoA dehydrogenase [Candidatus Rhodobacter lobularis]
MTEIKHIAVLGAGVIGASWAALFLAAGRSVAVFDPDPGAEDAARAYIKRAWPALQELGLTERATSDAIRFAPTASAAVAGAQFVQENVPERLAIKHATYQEIEPALAAGAIVSSATSGLTLEALQEGWRDPGKLILGHPFNPPHLIPLVELTANARTGAGVLESTEAFYQDIGKVTIRIKKGLPGHVANRLQAAVWREAVHMALEGVASVEDIDKAMWAGPGLRWAAMGPTMLFHLGAGDGGLEAFCAHFKDTFNGWWDGLGDPRLDADVIKKLVAGMDAQARGRSPEELSAERDRMLTALQAATRSLRS